MQNLDDAGQARSRSSEIDAGSEFDREYISAQIDGHRKLQIQQVYLRSPDDLDETNVAKLAHGMIKEHLTLLAEMQGMAGQRARARGHAALRPKREGLPSGRPLRPQRRSLGADRPSRLVAIVGASLARA